MASTAHISDAMTKAGTVLSSFRGCSRVMDKYPMINIRMMIVAIRYPSIDSDKLHQNVSDRASQYRELTWKSEAFI
jgi:hypothetical protein